MMVMTMTGGWSKAGAAALSESPDLLLGTAPLSQDPANVAHTASTMAALAPTPASNSLVFPKAA